jgi:hypothetical protein
MQRLPPCGEGFAGGKEIIFGELAVTRVSDFLLRKNPLVIEGQEGQVCETDHIGYTPSRGQIPNEFEADYCCGP